MCKKAREAEYTACFFIDTHHQGKNRQKKKKKLKVLHTKNIPTYLNQFRKET